MNIPYHSFSLLSPLDKNIFFITLYVFVALSSGLYFFFSVLLFYSTQGGNFRQADISVCSQFLHRSGAGQPDSASILFIMLSLHLRVHLFVSVLRCICLTNSSPHACTFFQMFADAKITATITPKQVTHKSALIQP